MLTYKVRLEIINERRRRKSLNIITQRDLAVLLSERGIDVDISSLSLICRNIRSTLNFDKELKIKEEIEKILKQIEDEI